MKSLAIAGLCLVSVLTAGVAHAAVITLNTTPAITYQQQNNSPCVIGDPSCQNPAGFGSTTLAANPAGDTYTNVGSPTYTVQQIRNIVGNTFVVGIDVNTNTSPLAQEVLDSFRLDIGGVNQFIFNTPTQLRTNNNGNGFSDAVLSGFDLSNFAANASAQFFVTYHGAVAGREQFFLAALPAPPSNPVPAPGALVLLGLGFAALGAARRFKA